MTEGGSDILKPVPDISKTGWKHEVTTSEGNQEPLEASAFKSTQTRMGVEVSWGQGPEGYDQWKIREPNGGGSVIIP
ncbi:MAG TPA: hypothetical protein VFD45_02855, partial [Patescibacteria group bacterium]|nr:hypothetical protein [Patescibacteria group bacterium]